MWETLRINTATKEIKRQPVEEKYRGLGGRSLIARFLNDEVKPTCDPLGSDNKLMLCTGVFAGTNLSTAHRLSLGAKSPLTGGIKESNAGGTLAYNIARHGLKYIVFEDLPSEEQDWSVLFIDKYGQAVLNDGSAYSGLNTYESFEAIRSKYGDKVAIAAIGNAGERQYRIAAVMVSDAHTGTPTRAAARGGLGAVMGSKKIKAIVIDRPEKAYKPEYANKEVFDKACHAFNKALASPECMTAMKQVGTNGNIDGTGSTGVLPIRNFSGDVSKKARDLSASVFLQKLKSQGGSNNHACQPGCAIKCSNSYHDADGEYLTGGFEYETLALCGPNLDIYDYDIIARIDRACDNLGVDTMDTGCAIGVCMDEGKLKFGDVDGVFALLKEMEDGTDFGRILGNGCEATGKFLGAKRIPTVKGQALAGYDPRGLKGTGVTYATSPMGADHTAGLTFGLPIDGTSKQMQIFMSQKMTGVFTLADSTMCAFALLGSTANIPLLFAMYGSLYGIKPTNENFMLKLTIDTLKLEKAFNRSAGFTPEDDRLPEFFYTERSTFSGAVFDISDSDLQLALPY